MKTKLARLTRLHIKEIEKGELEAERRTRKNAEQVTVDALNARNTAEADRDKARAQRDFLRGEIEKLQRDALDARSMVAAGEYCGARSLLWDMSQLYSTALNCGSAAGGESPTHNALWPADFRNAAHHAER